MTGKKQSRDRNASKILRKSKGASLAEYGLIVGLIGVAGIFGVSKLGSVVKTTFDGAVNTLSATSLSTPSFEVGQNNGSSEDLFVEDTTPDVFSFAKVVGGGLRTHTSDPIIISGINTPTPISIEQGEYSLDGEDWTALPGSVLEGQQVRVRQDVGVADQDYVAALNIGGVSSFYTVTVEPHVAGEVKFDGVGQTYAYTIPQNVYVINVIAVGGGAGGMAREGSGRVHTAGGGGGGLVYANTIPVTPGQILSVETGKSGLGEVLNDESDIDVLGPAIRGGISSVSLDIDNQLVARGGNRATDLTEQSWVGGQGGAGFSSGVFSSAVVYKGGSGGSMSRDFDDEVRSKGGDSATYASDGQNGVPGVFEDSTGQTMYCEPNAGQNLGGGGSAQVVPAQSTIQALDGGAGRVRIFWGQDRRVGLNEETCSLEASESNASFLN